MTSGSCKKLLGTASDAVSGIKAEFSLGLFWLIVSQSFNNFRLNGDVDGDSAFLGLLILSTKNLAWDKLIDIISYWKYNVDIQRQSEGIQKAKTL